MTLCVASVVMAAAVGSTAREFTAWVSGLRFGRCSSETGATVEGYGKTPRMTL